MHLESGDRVRVKDSIREGLGVVKEQAELAGQEFNVSHHVGYGIVLVGCDFVFKPTDLERID